MDYVVAVYGTLKKGFHNHFLMKNSTFIGEGTAPGKMYSAGGYPIATKEEGTMKVELYAVPGEDISSLDALEGHPEWYTREEVETSLGPAWIYYQPEENVSSRPVVESGEW